MNKQFITIIKICVPVIATTAAVVGWVGELRLENERNKHEVNQASLNNKFNILKEKNIKILDEYKDKLNARIETFDNASENSWNVDHGNLLIVDRSKSHRKKFRDVGSKYKNKGDYYLVGCDHQRDGVTTYFKTAGRFSGDWREFRSLKFSIASDGGRYYTNGYGSRGDVIISSGDIKAIYSLTHRPKPNWETFVIPLREDSNWILPEGSTLQNILENVSNLEIRAEYGVGEDCTGLDDVTLVLH